MRDLLEVLQRPIPGEDTETRRVREYLIDYVQGMMGRLEPGVSWDASAPATGQSSLELHVSQYRRDRGSYLLTAARDIRTACRLLRSNAVGSSAWWGAARLETEMWGAWSLLLFASCLPFPAADPMQARRVGQLLSLMEATCL